MGLHDLGYRRWNGKRNPAWSRWMVIASASIRGAWKSQWVRRLLMFAFVPAFWYAVGFFLFEQATQNPDWEREARAMIMMHARNPSIAHILQQDSPDAMRHEVWSTLLNSYIRNPQAIVMVLIIGLIAPPLISQDARSRAFLLYFSRPVDRSEYLLGKSAAVWTYLLLISAAPALALYFMGVLLSPRVDVIAATWDLPFRILLASAILIIPTTSLALMFSSLTQESRYAAFAWFVVWIIGWLAYSVLQTVLTGIAAQSEMTSTTNVWSLLSLFHILGEVQHWAFGFVPFSEVKYPAIFLVCLTIFCTSVLYRRISAPMRA